MPARHILGWIAVGAVGVMLQVWTQPRALPFAPRDWQITAREAEAIALEGFSDLGDDVEGAYTVVRLSSDPLLETRLHEAASEADEAALVGSPLANRVIYWEVLVYPPGALPGEWTYRARIAPDGELIALRMRVPQSEESGAIGVEEARAAAEAFLVERELPLARFGEPEARTRDLQSRTDLELRFPSLSPVLGERYPDGVSVGFAGERLTGYQFYFDDPDSSVLAARLQPSQFMGVGRNLVVLLLLPIVAVPFLRRYHAGEIGVRRALQVGGVVLGLVALLMLMTAESLSEGSSTGILTRVQMTWMIGLFFSGFVFVPVVLLTGLSWSVGESLCRERWGHKLAAFDALLQGDWANATLARSALRGVAAGAAISGLLGLAGLGLKSIGVWPVASFEIASWWFSSHWAGLVILVFFLVWMTYGELFGRLLVVPVAVQRLGRLAGGAVAAVIAGLVLWGPSLQVVPLGWHLAVSIAGAAALVALFLRFDLVTSLTASIFSACLAISQPLLSAADGWLQFQGMLAVIGGALPLVVSVRGLGSGREFHYHYDDVPLHVRRIAERERHKVELETARRIQSSILPELPPELNGVRIAHAYLPATEVGGDFYDVLALEDGRLAVAVGDVAGHGVSSGLVMSMARSALAVQVTFRPEVEEVFTTLNRMVYQSARKRLLTTLCYALVDPRGRQLLYASAGHLFPYRIGTDGSVYALESISYPLGVRGELDIAVRSANLSPGDQLFLFSDGVVEARRERGDELFGFERLEESLRSHATAGVTGIRDGVLEDIRRFTGGAPREDDLTLLVLQVP